MSLAALRHLTFDNSFARELPALHRPWQAARAPAPRVVARNDDLARELGLEPEALTAEVLVGNVLPEGAEPVAMAYAGHQFGGYSPRLGDGRALLLGEVIDARGRRRDLHLKGSGRTPFARGGDGKAALGPMLREYVIGEAMHALGIPTTRALAVVATGEEVLRETAQPGAVLVRVAASHLRVGTFQYAAATGGSELVRALADHAIARHHPAAAEAENPYLALLAAVVGAQADLVARWMVAGFVHGVMNTDNVTLSGETIDYGPCAFIDAFDPAAVFSSIDHAGRYAYGNQPTITQWNLARLAETLLGLVDSDAALETLQTFAERFNARWLSGMRARLGLQGEQTEDLGIIDDLLRLMHDDGVDYTSCLRALGHGTARDHFTDRDAFEAWSRRWDPRRDPATDPDAVNPACIPRNHLVEEALTAATAGDLEPFRRLVEVVRRPFELRSGDERYAEPAPEAFTRTYRTFCGT